MKKLKGILVLVLLLALLTSPIAVLASDISSARYYGTIIVSNNSTATTNVAVNCTISTQALIDGGYLNSSANNCVVRSSAGADLEFMPSVNASYPWCIWVPSIGQDASTADILYTANSTGGEIRYFPATGGMTSSDNDTNFELGDNFTVEQKGWVQTTFTDNYTDRNLVYKEDAFRTYVSATGNITSQIGNSIGGLIPGNGIALDFVRGNSDWVSIPDSPDLDFTDGAGNDEAGTIIVWVNLDDATSSTLLAKYTGVNQLAWRFFTTAGDLLVFDCLHNDASGIIGRGTAAITIYQGQWIQLASTYDGSETSAGINLYINGVDADTIDSESLPYTGMSDTTSIVEIGAKGGVDYLDGTMAEAKIYKAELTSTEILADYNGGHRSTNLEAWWRLDDRVGNPQDNANAHHATANSADWVICPTVIAPDISSGEHTVRAIADGTFFYLEHNTITWDDYAPIKANLVFNAPLWHPELDTSPLTTKDVDEYSGVVTDAVWSSDGYYFDGVSAIIKVTAAFRSSDVAGSALIWFKSVGGAAGNVISSADEATTSRYLNFGVDAGGTFFVQERAGGSTDYGKGAITINDNEWHQGAVTSNGTHYRMFVDGVEDSINFTSGANNGHWYAEVAAQDNLTIGAMVRTTPSYYNVWCGEAQIYSQVLTPDEVLASYNATKWKYDGSTEYFHYNLVGTGVPNTTANWIFLQNDVMRYMEYLDIEIDGVEQQRIEWEYDTTFTDLSGKDHDATPTFRTTSSDPDVSAVLTSFLPVSEAKAPAYALEDAPAFIETVPTIVSEWAVTPPAGTFPLAGVVRAIASATATPAQLPLLIIAGFVIIAFSLATSATMRRYGSGSLIAKSLVITAVMGVFIAIGNFGIDFWMLFVFLIIAVALSMGSKQVGWQ